jgi:branched-chain amino acid transport system substrate-binding protein
MKGATFLSLLALAIVSVVNAPASADILVGAAGGLTGSNAHTGEQQRKGVERAIADLNSTGGLLGQKLRLTAVDDACDSDQAVVAARKLVNDRVAFVVGHTCSGAAIPAASIYQNAGIVLISATATNPTLTEEGHSNVFRVCGRDDQQGTVAGNYLADRWGKKKIAIVHDGTVYGKRLAAETKKQLNKRGVTEAIFEAYTPGLNDYSSLIGKLQAANASVLYVGGYYQEAALLIRTARNRNYPLQLVSGDALATDGFAQIAGSAAEGTIFTFFPDARRNAGAQQVVKQFRAAQHEPEGYTLYGYAAVQTWAQAVQRAGTLDTEAVVKALRDGQFDTVLGKIAFDSKGDITTPGFVWNIWKNGKYVPLK